MKNVIYYQRAKGGVLEALPAEVINIRSERVVDLRVSPPGEGKKPFVVTHAQRSDVPTHGYFSEVGQDTHDTP